MQYPNQQLSPYEVNVRVDNVPLPVSPAKKNARFTLGHDSTNNAGATEDIRDLYFRSLPSLALQLGLFTFFLTGYGSVYGVQESVSLLGSVPLANSGGAMIYYAQAQMYRSLDGGAPVFFCAGFFAALAAVCVPFAAILKRSAPIVWAFSFFALAQIPLHFKEAMDVVAKSDAKDIASAVTVTLVVLSGVLVGMFCAVKARSEKSAFGNRALDGISYPLASIVLAAAGSTLRLSATQNSNVWMHITLGFITGILMLFFQWYFKRPSCALLIYVFAWFAFRVIASNEAKFGKQTAMTWDVWVAFQLQAVCALLTLGALLSVLKESMSTKYASLYLCYAAVLDVVSETWVAYTVGSLSIIGAVMATSLVLVSAERRFRLGMPVRAPHHRQVIFYASVWTLSWAAIYCVRAGLFWNEWHLYAKIGFQMKNGVLIASSFTVLVAALAMTALACISLYKTK